MRRFLAHLLRFGSFPVAALLTLEAVLLGSGEAWPVDRVIAFQQSHPESLFLRAVDQAFYASKYHGILARQPSILVIGSSRTMKFRRGMFGDRADSFFNAGGLANSLSDLEAFCVTNRPRRLPEILIIGVDLWWLNEKVRPVYRFEQEIARAAPGFDEHIIAMRWLLRRPGTLVREIVSLTMRRQPEKIGIAAREGRGGFRPDGSFESAWPLPQSGGEWTFVDREDPPIIERVRTGTANFLPTDRISPQRLQALGSILDRYRDEHVLVIGYLPPFSSAVAETLSSDPRHSTFFAEFRRVVPELFTARGFPIVDASNAETFGMDDRAMSDGFHGEETLHARVVKQMLQDSRVGSVLPGAESAIDRALRSPRTNYWQIDLSP